jgi:hypothetical protein
MAKQNINVGTTANDKKGDSLRTAFQKVNANFTELYTQLGLNDPTLNLGAFEFTGSVLSTTDSTAITIDQATTITSNLTVGGDILPQTANGGDLGSLARPFRSLYVSNSTVYFGGVPLSLEPGTNELRVNNVPISQNITYADIPNAPVDVSDLTDRDDLLSGGGGGAGPVQPYLELTDSPFIIQPSVLTTVVSFTRTANGSETDSIDTGLTLARGNIGALYNAEVEQSYDRNSHAQPTGTAWNADGWGDLSNLISRSYTTLYEALNQAVGENIIGAELVMWDTINGKFYKFSFTDWGGNNGGSFAYTRTRIEDPNYFRKVDYATANNVDVIEDDSTLQIGITRDNNNGIYNPFTEEDWNSNVSPAGTLWNIDGWNDLSDLTDRTYDNLYAAFGNGGLGAKIVGTECVMSVPSIDKYYAVKFLSWTQNNAGGGFSYTRYEIDQTKLDRGVKFSDGTVQTTAYIDTNVVSTATGDRRIETASGYKSVSVTVRGTKNLTTTASRDSDNGYIIWIDRTTTTIDEVLNNYYEAGILDSSTIEFSLDNTTWYTFDNGTASDGEERGYYVVTGIPLDYDQGDTVYFRYVGGGAPQVWWDKSDLPGGSNDFRGAIIDYHAYTGQGTIIGTIHIADDDGDENITHTEVSSADNEDSMHDNLWIVSDEGTIRYARFDGDARTLKIHWTAKVFYGSDYSDD